MMYRKFGFAMAAVAVLGMSLGCSGVEKRSRVNEGTAIGGGLGTVIGAGAGHATAFGAGPGALVGLGLGAATGALTTGWYYDDPDTRHYDPAELERLQAALESRGRDVAQLEAQKTALMEANRQMQEDLERLQRGAGGADVQLSVHPSGAYKVTMLADVMFDSGSANLTAEGKSILARAARQIRDQFPNAFIEVRGHSDSVPITHSNWDSNWHLSAARAVGVLHYLVNEQNFSQERIRAVGFADTVPVASNETPSGRSKNRRAEIVIMPSGSPAARELGLN